MATDYYQILGVPKGASEKEIKRAYRRLARQNHPDVNRDDRAAADRFKGIQEAYRVLGDSKLREQYDRFGTTFEQGGPGPGADGSPFGPGGGFRFSGQNVDLTESDLGDLLGGLFGGRGRRRGPAAVPGRDAEVVLALSLEEVARGAERDVTVMLEDVCAACGGRGIAGAGASCRQCGGLGAQRRQETLRGLRIPAGVQHGEVIRARGKGGHGSAGAPSGDLLIRVDVRPHVFFERQGNDLVAEVPVTLAEAALGAEIRVPTLTETKPLRLAPGTQGGQRIRIRGYGLPDRKTGERGALVVRIRVAVPTDLQPAEQRMIEAISARGGDPRADLWQPRSGR